MPRKDPEVTSFTGLVVNDGKMEYYYKTTEYGNHALVFKKDIELEKDMKQMASSALKGWTLTTPERREANETEERFAEFVTGVKSRMRSILSGSGTLDELNRFVNNEHTSHDGMYVNQAELERIQEAVKKLENELTVEQLKILQPFDIFL